MPAILFICGAILTAYGGWRGWVNGRSMLAPAVHPPDSGNGPDGRPRRPRSTSPGAPAEIRRAVWRLALAVGWLLLAMLGLYMMTVANEAGL
jgi:hypothetical protein